MCIYIHINIHIYISLCISSISIYLSVYLSFYLSIHPSIHPSIYLLVIYIISLSSTNGSFPMGAWSSFLANLDEHQARALSSPGNIKMRLGNVWEMDLPGKWLVLQVLNHPFSILIEKERERHRRPSPLFAGSTLGFYGGFQRGIAERAGWWTTCHERGRMMIAGPSMCNSYQQLLFEDGWKSLCIYMSLFTYIYIT